MPNRFTQLFFGTGYVLIVGGCGLWSRPLGMVVAGFGLILAAWVRTAAAARLANKGK